MNIDSNIHEDIIGSGAHKRTTKPDVLGYVNKFFNNNSEYKPYPIEEQNKIIEKKKKYFGKFIPETKLIEIEDRPGYYIKQKYIKGKLLKSVDINQLDKNVLSDLLELFNGYIAYCKNEGKKIDVLGYQQDICNINNIRKRRVLYYTRMLNGFLSSTNIMLSNDSRVYMVDVCDTIPIQKKNNISDKIKHTLSKAIMEVGINITLLKMSVIKKQKELYKLLS